MSGLSFFVFKKNRQGGPSLQNVGYSCETKIFIRTPAEVSAIRILTVEILHAKYPNLPPPPKKNLSKFNSEKSFIGIYAEQLIRYGYYTNTTDIKLIH